ncbi:MAG: hypothetical protein QOH23_1492 [Gaiellaceae bacterium]|nr:hypothetical protein [Gaiellaceae bacterium]
MRPSQVGLLLGAILGLALVLKDFGDMLIVGLVALVGWIVARVLEGELDLTEFLGGKNRNPQSGR